MDFTFFVVDTSELNHDSVDVSVQFQGQLVPYQVEQHISSIDSQLVNFVPKSEGTYTVSVKCLNKHITGIYSFTHCKFCNIQVTLYSISRNFATCECPEHSFRRMENFQILKLDHEISVQPKDPLFLGESPEIKSRRHQQPHKMGTR